jgi:hypothetical protein
MKNCFLLLVFIILSSCNSGDSDYIDIAAQNSLQGRWNWVSTTGGFDGVTATPASTNTTVVLEFSDSSYKEYRNGILVYNRKFFVITQPSIFGGERKMLLFDGANSLSNKASLTRPIVNQSFEIIDNKLYIRDECADCYISEYEQNKLIIY